MRQLLVDIFAERREQAIGLLRVENLHERAIAADVRDERASEKRVFAIDVALEELRELAILGDKSLDALGKPAVLGIEVFLELDFRSVLEQCSYAGRTFFAGRRRGGRPRGGRHRH